jgi:hypothetical protein
VTGSESQSASHHTLLVIRLAGAAATPGVVATVTVAILLAIVSGGCAPKRLALPTGAGTPVADATSILAEALGHCAGLRTLTTEIGLSGRAAGQRIRVRLIAGLAAPDGIRLEAMAPIGPPVFILASAGEHTTLLLPRDDRVLRGEPPAAILEALAGIRVTPAALRRLLAGCPAEDVDAGDVRAIGEDWRLARTGDRGTAYVHRVSGRWRLAAVRGTALDVEFGQGAAAQPDYVRFRSPEASTSAAFDLTLRLSQVEVDVDVPDEAFTVRVPADAAAISLEELRESGPLRDRSGS